MFVTASLRSTDPRTRTNAQDCFSTAITLRGGRASQNECPERVSSGKCFMFPVISHVPETCASLRNGKSAKSGRLVGQLIVGLVVVDFPRSGIRAIGREAMSCELRAFCNVTIFLGDHRACDHSVNGHKQSYQRETSCRAQMVDRTGRDCDSMGYILYIHAIAA